MKIDKLTKQQLINIIIDQTILLNSYEEIFRIRFLAKQSDVEIPDELLQLLDQKPTKQKKQEQEISIQ